MSAAAELTELLEYSRRETLRDPRMVRVSVAVMDDLWSEMVAAGAIQTSESGRPMFDGVEIEPSDFVHPALKFEVVM